MPTKKQATHAPKASSAPKAKASAPKTRGKAKAKAAGLLSPEPKAEALLAATPSQATEAPKAKPQAAPVAEVAIAKQDAAIAVAEEMVPQGPRSLPTIAAYQRALAQAGCYQGLWDGQYGHLTREATARYQAAKGFAVTGDPSPALLVALGF